MVEQLLRVLSAGSPCSWLTNVRWLEQECLLRQCPATRTSGLAVWSVTMFARLWCLTGHCL